MNWYKKNIGDYLRKTVHLTMLQDGAFNRMLDHYYLHEKPLPLDRDSLYARVRAHTTEDKWATDEILAEFFRETKRGFVNDRADEEIKAYHLRAKAAQTNGLRGGRPKTNSVPIGFDLANPEESSENLESRTKKEEKSKPMSANADAGIPPRQIFEIFVQERGGLPGVRDLTPDRLSKCRTRLLNHKADQQKFLAEFRAAVRKAGQLPWPEWRPHFDWFVENDSNYLKVLEGKYDHWGKNGAGNNAEARKNAIQLARERHNLGGAGEVADASRKSA